ncbi:hypothetical protein [Pseudothermotoga elfii]
MLLKMVFNLLLVAVFLSTVLPIMSVIDRITQHIQPYYIKCAVFKALEWVRREIPGQVVINNTSGTKKLIIKTIRIDEKETKILSLDFKNTVEFNTRNNNAIELSPICVSNAGSIDLGSWTITFPPAVVKVNIKEER